jgi:glucose-1-phosphate thymidylyltransferase
MVEKAIVVATEPMALLPVANRPLVAHALDSLSCAGVKRTALAVQSSIRDQVDRELAHLRPDGTEVIAVDHDRGGGLPAALADLHDFVGQDPFVLHLGDSLDRSSLRSGLQVPTAELDSTVFVQETEAEERVVELARRRVPDVAGADHRAAAGVWVLGAGALDAVQEVETSGSTELDVSCAIRKLADQGGRVSVRRMSEWWRFGERPDALLDANRFALQGLCSVAVEAHLVDTRIQGPVRIHPSARLESSIVRGPVVVGPGTCLRDAYIGPYTSIGENVLIEGAEIEHSIILEGSSVSHLGGRLEASVLGPNARVFRDFRLPKATRLTVGEGAEVSLG